MSTSFPSPVAVGQTNVAGALTIRNLSNGPDAGGRLPISSIFFTPSCGSGLAAGQAPPTCSVFGLRDPGVFSLGVSAVGRAGTGCAGFVFSVTVVDAADGSYSFDDTRSQVVLGGVGTATDMCIIDFSATVLKVPTIDQDPAVPGIQTAQLASAFGGSPGFSGNTGSSSSIVTVTKAIQPPPPPPPPPPAAAPAASFVGSPKSLRVSKTGRFTYKFLATPLSSGTIKLQSIKKITVGTKKRFIMIGPKMFTAPATATARVKVTFKLSTQYLKALKRARSVRFNVTVTLAGKTFTTTLKLKAP